MGRPWNATVHRSRRRKTMISEKTRSAASMQPIVPRPVLFWVLVGHWEGTPFPIMRGQTPPPFSVWSVTDQKWIVSFRSKPAKMFGRNDGKQYIHN